MKSEDKDDNIGHCTLSSLENGYIQEDIHGLDPELDAFPLKKYIHDIAVSKVKDPMVDRLKPIVIPDPEIIAKIRDEIDSRGCFSIDVPKLVDVLFKLGIIVPREDFK